MRRRHSTLTVANGRLLAGGMLPVEGRRVVLVLGQGVHRAQGFGLIASGASSAVLGKGCLVARLPSRSGHAAVFQHGGGYGGHMHRL